MNYILLRGRDPSPPSVVKVVGVEHLQRDVQKYNGYKNTFRRGGSRRSKQLNLLPGEDHPLLNERRSSKNLSRLILNFQEKIKSGFHVLTDGGTSCNSPSRGFGTTYGSVKIWNQGEMIHYDGKIKFQKGSNNVAEVSIILYSLSLIAQKQHEKDELFSTPSYIHLHTDSMIAINQLKSILRQRRKKVHKSSSQQFIDVLNDLEDFINLNIHLNIKPHHAPREIAVHYLGH